MPIFVGLVREVVDYQSRRIAIAFVLVCWKARPWPLVHIARLVKSVCVGVCLCLRERERERVVCFVKIVFERRKKVVWLVFESILYGFLYFWFWKSVIFFPPIGRDGKGSGGWFWGKSEGVSGPGQVRLFFAFSKPRGRPSGPPSRTTLFFFVLFLHSRKDT